MTVTRSAQIVATLLAVTTVTSFAHADDRRREYTAEFNAFHNFSRTRLYLLANTSKVEGRDELQNQLGVHFDVSTKRGLRERLNLADWARERTVGLRVGYRQMRNWDGEREDVNERRALAELTLQGTLPNKFSIAHRLGFDYRDLSSGQSQRYRYRLNLEREMTAGQTVLVPYFQAEFIYDSRYSAWSRQHYQLGSEIALSKHWRLEPYVSVDKDVEPDETYTDGIGLIAKYYW